MELDQFNFSLPIQVRWNDLDALGHVNNAVFVTYFEIARGRFMLEACPGWDWSKDMFLVANVHVDFRRELLLTADEPKVMVKTSKIGTKSFVLEYAIVSNPGEELVIYATGTTTQVMFDMKSRQTVEVPEWVRASLMAFDQLST